MKTAGIRKLLCPVSRYFVAHIDTLTYSVFTSVQSMGMRSMLLLGPPGLRREVSLPSLTPIPPLYFPLILFVGTRLQERRSGAFPGDPEMPLALSLGVSAFLLSPL